MQWYLVNRTDGTDETLASASNYAKKYGMGLPSLYDTQLKFRYTLGINFIPTTILLNPQGEVELMIPRILKSASEVRALLDYAVNSAANATTDYVKKNLMLSDGTVKMAEASKRTSSAAQSLLMEYASTAFDRELLNTQRNWLAANQTTGDLGDDLRFSKALSAQKGYEVASCSTPSATGLLPTKPPEISATTCGFRKPSPPKRAMRWMRWSWSSS